MTHARFHTGLTKVSFKNVSTCKKINNHTAVELLTSKTTRHVSRTHIYIMLATQPYPIVQGRTNKFFFHNFILFIYFHTSNSLRFKDEPANSRVFNPNPPCPRTRPSRHERRHDGEVQGKKHTHDGGLFSYTRLFLLKIFLYKVSVNKRFFTNGFRVRRVVYVYLCVHRASHSYI